MDILRGSIDPAVAEGRDSLAALSVGGFRGARGAPPYVLICLAAEEGRDVEVVVRGVDLLVALDACLGGAAAAPRADAGRGAGAVGRGPDGRSRHLEDLAADDRQRLLLLEACRDHGDADLVGEGGID